ncbi:MAG: hypothetical protein F4Y86_04490 [Gammaproteobacteria bacterium]|nr:hypothetical protein [Gammaproteobacteria bacterium]
MTFPDERAFETHLRNIIASDITSETPKVYALDHKTIGDIVIARDGASPALFFLEVKYFQSSKGRLGVGTGAGGGIQPEILKRGPAYLETHLRWAFASDHHNPDEYWLATSDVVRQFIAGGGRQKAEQHSGTYSP